MNERDIFDEKRETKPAQYACTFCGERNEYQILWLKRTKKKNTPARLNAQDRVRYDKSKDYMVRIDDAVVCKNQRCRRRFEIPSSQSVVFI